jgi:hypothetical protein
MEVLAENLNAAFSRIKTTLHNLGSNLGRWETGD